MSDIKTNAATVNAQTVAKKVRRGVSNKTQAVAQLKFHEKDAAQNGLFVGHLEEVRVDWSNNADAKSFTGMSIPRLTFHFASNHANASEKRHVYQTLFPVESNVNTIPGGSEDWRVNNVFNWIKHILDVFYLKGREMTEAEEDALSLTFEDFDENGEYVSVEVEDVIAGYRAIFENAAAMLNGSFELADGEVAKPVYKTSDGKYIPCWLKLLRHKKRKGDWINVGANGDLAFDGFIGNGVVELLKKDCPPTVLRLDLAKESITPKETKKTPTIGAPGMGAPAMGGVMAGAPSMGMPVDNGAFQAAGEDMPF
nr:MAG: hypothetical protein [Bacteriophage sp.]